MKIATIALTIVIGIAAYPAYVEVFDALYAMIPFPNPTDFTARFIGLGVYLLLIAVFIAPLFFFMRGRYDKKNDDGPPRGGEQF